MRIRSCHVVNFPVDVLTAGRWLAGAFELRVVDAVSSFFCLVALVSLGLDRPIRGGETCLTG